VSVSACIALLKAEVERKRSPTPIISWPVGGSSPLTHPSESKNVIQFAPSGGHDLPRACRSCRLANAQLTLEPSLNNALSPVGQNFRGNSNKFRSSQSGL
jgi:hypothetical protein